MKEELLIFDNNHNPTEKFFDKLGKNERDVIEKFEKYCLISAGEGRTKKYKSDIIRFLIMANKPFKDICLDDLRDFLRILKQSKFSDYTKNDIKGHIQRFLRWHFKDWSERFDNFEDVKFNSEPQRKIEIKPEDILSKGDVEKLIKAEPDIFWKTFIVCQYQGALRTLETRTLKWDMVDMQESDIGWLNISSKKNKNAINKKRIAVPLDEKAIYLLNELKKWQTTTNKKSPYLFPSKQDLNAPISSATTNMWFRRLTEKVLGKKVKNYLLRHSQGEHLHNLIREGKLSKENALLMMGHSEKMFDKTYSHADKQNLKEVLKKQVLDIDYIAPEKKHELEIKIERLTGDNKQIKKKIVRIEALLRSVLDKGNKSMLKIENKVKTK